jgi:uncharacterized protein with HEPN domain
VHKKELVFEILHQIDDAIEMIKFRFEPVGSVDYFLDTPLGKEKLDSICKLFIAIGESLKKIDKLTDKKLLSQYSQVDFKAIKGMRDVLSHHYFDINAEAVYNVCVEDIDDLHSVIKSIITDMNNTDTATS